VVDGLVAGDGWFHGLSLGDGWGWRQPRSLSVVRRPVLSPRRGDGV